MACVFPGRRVFFKKRFQRNVVKKPVQVNMMVKTIVAKTSGRNALAFERSEKPLPEPSSRNMVEVSSRNAFKKRAHRFASDVTLHALLPNQSPVLGGYYTS